MGEKKLLKGVGTLDHIKQKNDESLGDFDTKFNKELTGIDQVITGDETIRAFLRALGLRVSALYDNLSVIPVITVEEMAVMVKSSIDLEITKEGRKMTHKETEKVVQVGKKIEKHPSKP